MEMKVEIISEEVIKPSSPTPPHLKSLKLSLLDQLAPPIYVTLVFFYPTHHHHLNNTNTSLLLLKQSLSQILTTFYPLAGRVNLRDSSSFIDCNDSGAAFVEARVHGTRLSQLLQDPNMDELKKLEPVDPLAWRIRRDQDHDHEEEEEEEKSLLAVKVSLFECGGMAVGVSIFHKVADGTSMVAFINAWAAACRGDDTAKPNFFDLASCFPPTDAALVHTQHVGVVETGNIVTKRFVFSDDKIAELKRRSSSSATRVEAVSAYMWQLFMEVARSSAAAAGTTTSTQPSSFVALHAVNLRPRRNPPLAEDAFGNCWRPALAAADGEYYSDLATKLRVSIRSIDDEFIKKVENGEYLREQARLAGMFSSGGVEFLNFSSWCGFPVYKVDFGWGKPAWVCTTTLPFKNVVILINTPSCGQRIEAWINMLHHDMNVFQHHLNNFLITTC